MMFCVVAKIEDHVDSSQFEIQKHIQANNAEEAICLFVKIYANENNTITNCSLIEVTHVFTIESTTV